MEHPMAKALVHMLLNAAVFLLLAKYLPGFYVNGWVSSIVASLLLGIVNATFGLILTILTFPLIILTLGLFSFVVNAIVILLVVTESNPTRVGLPGAGPVELRALSDTRGSLYEPDPLGSLGAREAVARYYAGRVSAGDLVLVASTSEAYAHLMRLLCDAGDEILIPMPSYPLFAPLAALEEVRVESYRLAYHDRWQLDMDSLEAAVSPRTRAVVLVQPNNPTGSCLSGDEAARVESFCTQRSIAIISDEVFGD